MHVAMTSRKSDTYAEEGQKGRLSKLAKVQWLERNDTFNHVFQQYLVIHSVSQSVSQSVSLTVSQSLSLTCDLVVKVHMHTFL